MFTLELSEKNLHTAWHVDSDVPREIISDKARLRQVLLNLVGNAVKFTSEGSVELHVKNNGTKNGKQSLRFTVRDTGIGIPAEKQSELFESFSQVDSSTTRPHGGTGLGLAICKNIVEMMEGEIEVESREGEGSTFRFTIMVEVAEQGECEEYRKIHSSGENQPESGGSGRDVRLLVVEDNQINQLVTLKVLEKMGIRADVASDGREALSSARENPYDIIFMDLQMPEMDGFEATSRIREQEEEDSKTVIIAMTADAQSQIREKCLEAGMDDYLSKPVQLRDLREAVSKWINRRAEMTARQI